VVFIAIWLVYYNLSYNFDRIVDNHEFWRIPKFNVLGRGEDAKSTTVLGEVSQYAKYKARQVETKDVKSDVLVSTILKRGNIEERYRLHALLAKFIRGQNPKGYQHDVSRLLSRWDVRDANVIAGVKINTRDATARDEIHIDALERMTRATGLTDMAGKPAKSPVISYLDYGCGDGAVAVGLGERLGAAKTCGVDVASWVTDFKRHPSLEFKLIENDRIPYPDAAFNLATANMVLHHVENVDAGIRELARVIRKGGYLIIREHDNYGGIDNALADLEHEFWNATHGTPLEDFRKTYYAKYHDYTEWDAMLDKVGFTRVYMEYVHNDFPLKISPTRMYYAVYRHGRG